MTNSKQVVTYDSADRTPAALEELRSLFRYQHLVIQMVRRDILTRYKRSVLGIAWTMLNPLGTMLVLTIVFQYAFGRQEGYAAYVLSGLVAWTFFAQTTHAATVNLVWGGGLLKRIYAPRTVFALSAIGTGLINLTLSLVPVLIVMLATRVPIRPALLFFPIPMIFLAMFSLGMGLLISTIAVFFADVIEMYQIFLTAWMYLSPIIYFPDYLPEEFRIWIVRLNPMFHLIQLFRAPIYDGRVPEISEFLLSGGIAVGTLVIGWIFFTKKADEIAYRL
ncbi:MAG: ABC transporter permease [Chloroflexota bacterium]|nr:MAG: ABC transporter permease [Chloroflexota bacterium]